MISKASTSQGMETAHCLLDECSPQYETRVLKYIEPARCTSRDNEITAGKTDKKLKLDAGSLAIKETKSVPDESISTTYHISMCLRRRGLAYEFANLISFRAHEQYVERLLRHLSTEPPVGFQSTTLAQIMRADTEVFAFLAHNVVDIRPTAANVRPLDAALEDALRDSNMAFHLVPLPQAAVREDIQYAPKKSWVSSVEERIRINLYFLENLHLLFYIVSFMAYKRASAATCLVTFVLDNMNEAT